ncbi:MAG: Ig-like domain-containing protein [Mycobacterium sp.]
MATDYAKHVGRIGALAVALGIGYGLTPGMAAATPESAGTESSSPASPSSSSSPSNPSEPSGPTPSSTDPADDPGPAPDGEPETDKPEPTARPTATQAPKSSTSRSRAVRGAGCTTCRDIDESTTPTLRTTAKADTISTELERKDTTPSPAVPALEPVATPVAAGPVEPQPIPEVTAPPVTATPIATDTASQAPSADGIPDLPEGTPAAWALLAWTRRQSDEPVALAAAAVTNAPPAASPSQQTPDQNTGAVSGAINGSDVESAPLIYTVAGVAPARGTVVVNRTTGTYTYTPTAAARLAANVTATPDFDSFSVSVSDGANVTTVTVTVPVLPAAISAAPSKGVGGYPTGVVVSATTIYVTNAGSYSVSVIDRVTGATSTIKVISEPKALALSPDGTRLYVGGSNAVSVINTTTNAVVAKVTTNGGQIYGIDFSDNGQRVYVANSGKNTVSVIDTTKATPVVIATVAVGAQPRGIVVAGNRLYVANWGAGTVSVIDTTTNSAVRSPIAVGAKPSDLAVSADGTRVYVSNFGSGTVSVINPTAATPVIGVITVGAQPMGMALSPDGSVLYVANGRDTISVIDTAGRAVINTVSIDSSPENGSHRLALSPDGRQIYVTDMADNSLRILNLVRGNTAPIAGTPTVGTPHAQTGAVSGALNFTDADGDPLTYTVVSPPANGTLTINSAGTFTFTPSQTARLVGGSTVTFSVRAGDGTATGTVTVTVPVTPGQVTVPGDSTSLLQSMFDALRPGDTLTLAPQTYQHSGVLTIRVAGVTINGNGATLLATNDSTSAVKILADNVTLKDITLGAPLTGPRYYAPEQHKLVIMADHVTVTDVVINGSAGAGIYIDGSGYFELNDVRVIRSRADGIHMTNGSHDGVVNNPYTEWTGDDGVAVVSYVPDKAMSRNITINNPVVNGTVWGRGVSVVGGENITYNNITVSNTDSAGVYIASEWSYNTRGVDGVQINGGTVTNANTNPATVHGAILVYAGNAATAVRNVTFADLTVAGTPATATRIIGMIRENGATISGIVFRNLALQRSNSIPVSYTNALAAAYQLIAVTINGVPITAL